jgi:hypothetical protein
MVLPKVNLNFMYAIKKIEEDNSTSWFYITPGINAAGADISLVNNNFVLKLSASEPFDVVQEYKWLVPSGYDPDSFSFGFKDGILKVSGTKFTKTKKFSAVDLS